MEKQKLNFNLPINPPTATAQMKSVAYCNGKPFFYDKPKTKEARKILSRALLDYAPAEPLTGPISLVCVWKFPKNKSHKHAEFRITRPDTDNLQKLLKDVMTQAGYWKDDAQVCVEHVEKVWVNEENQGIYIEIEQIDKFKQL